MNNKLQNYYDMLKEFYYEKNGLDDTIDFLKFMLNELENIKNEENN